MASKKRGHMTWAAYNFGEDGDPALYAAKTAIADSGLSFKEIHERGGATVKTQTKWFLKEVRSCRFDALMATMRAAGGDIVFVSPKGTQVKVSHPRVQNARKKQVK